jgi:putative phage-type endonuclease
MDKDTWREQRNKGIGGSDVGAIVGVNGYKTAVDIYLDKIGQGKDYEESEAAYWGTNLEDKVAREFELRTGKKLKKRNAILQHPEYTFMLANVDRLVIGEKAGFEAKTTSAYNKEQWTGEEIPESYVLQCMHYMIVTGLKKWYIAVLIGGQQFEWKEINWDQELADFVIQIEKDFWENHVMKKIPPQLDGSEASTNILKHLYPEAKENTAIDLDPEHELMLLEAVDMEKQIKDLETKLEERKNRIKDYMGNNEEGISSEYIVKWSNTKDRETFDTKRFKVDNPDLAEKYIKVGEPSRKFTIKKK